MFLFLFPRMCEIRVSGVFFAPPQSPRRCEGVIDCVSFGSSRMPERRHPILKDFGIWASQIPFFFWPAGADHSLPEGILEK